jgi:iron complex transport system substrate-binding protein
MASPYLRNMKRIRVLISVVVLIGCGQPNDNSETTDKQEVSLIGMKYAKGFDIIVNGSLRCLQLYDLERDDGSVLCTVCNEPTSQRFSSEVVTLPPQNALRIATVSTTHIALLAAIGSLDYVVGTGYADRVMHPAGQAAIKEGAIVDLTGENDLDTERTLARQPSIITTYPFGGNSYATFRAAGVAVIPLSEYLETHPLGRAEWVKAVGFLTHQEHTAKLAFEVIEKRYNALAERTDSIALDQRPVVFTGSHANGQWYAPPANSFMGVFTRDAGGRYLFNDVKQRGNLTLDFEQFIERAMTAEYWGKIIYNPGPLTLADVRNEDPRYAELPAFKNKGVFYCNAAETDYFGEAVVAPDVVLADLIAILHPGVLPGHAPTYFNPIDE